MPMTVALCLTLLAPLAVVDSPERPQARVMAGTTADGQDIEFKAQRGTITLGKVAEIEVPGGFFYLSPTDAETLLTKIWHNPPGNETLGMLVAESEGPEAEVMNWGVVLTYEDDGHVADDDAGAIDYTELLAAMQKDVVADNAERRKAGYSGVRQLRWAAPPTYDAAAHKMFWAKDIEWDEGDHHTLNYDVRVLGREGILVLRAVADMADFAEVQAHMPRVIEGTNFVRQESYESFDPATGKLAAYGLAALVAGKVAAKVGFFKGIVFGLIAFKKILLVGLVAVGTWFQSWFRGRRSDSTRPPADG